MHKMVLEFSPEGKPQGVLKHHRARGTFLGCAGPSHAFQVGHPVNATSDPQLSWAHPDCPLPWFPECLWGAGSGSHPELLWALVAFPLCVVGTQ